MQHGPAQAVPLGSGEVAVTGFDGTVTVWEPDRAVAVGTLVPGAPSAGRAGSLGRSEVMSPSPLAA